MKTHLRLSIALFLSIIFVVTLQAQSSGKVAGWKTFKHKSFSIQYPQEWNVDAEQDGNVIVMFTNPVTDDALASGLASVNVLKEDLLGGSYTLEEYYELNLGKLKKSFEDVEIMTEVDNSANGHDYKEISYSFQYEGITLRLTQRIYISDGFGWVLTFGGMYSDTEDYYKMFKKDGFRIMDTFRLK
jgi:hypothetical protein